MEKYLQAEKDSVESSVINKINDLITWKNKRWFELLSKQETMFFRDLSREHNIYKIWIEYKNLWDFGFISTKVKDLIDTYWSKIITYTIWDIIFIRVLESSWNDITYFFDKNIWEEIKNTLPEDISFISKLTNYLQWTYVFWKRWINWNYYFFRKIENWNFVNILPDWLEGYDTIKNLEINSDEETYSFSSFWKKYIFSYIDFIKKWYIDKKDIIEIPSVYTKVQTKLSNMISIIFSKP